MLSREARMRVSLSREQRDELLGWLRRTNIAAGLAKRARAMLLLAEGTNVSETARLVDLQRRHLYKWIERFQEAGPVGLEDLGHRPQSCAHATPEPIVQEILKLRFQHPTWGARKLRARLEQTRGDTHWPAAIPPHINNETC